MVWAIYRWLTRGGYCAWRWSQHGRVPHFMWSSTRQYWWGYYPDKTFHVTLWTCWLVALFRGTVRLESNRRRQR